MFAAKPELSQRCISGLLTTGPNDENVNNKPSSDMQQNQTSCKRFTNRYIYN